MLISSKNNCNLHKNFPMINGQIVWFEIPVIDLDRATKFYSEVLGVKIERRTFLETENGILNFDKDAIKGVLVVKEDHKPGQGIVLFFFVVDLLESLEKVTELGGKILVNKTLLKQKTASGSLTINSNLIDNNLGYYAEFIDCEGNRICLYSNS